MTVTDELRQIGLFDRTQTGPFEFSALADLEPAARSCTRCGLRTGCRGVVVGEGNPRARLMLIGEGPGATEDELGRPFVGRAGQLLDRILAAAGFAREDVYITNIVKCRPPGNRLPEAAEAEACRPWLDAQIRLIAPAVIVCLGALATKTLVDPRARITRCRGLWTKRDGILYMPTFHPAALLRDPGKKRSVWDDFQLVRDAVAGSGVMTDGQAGPEDNEPGTDDPDRGSGG